MSTLNQLANALEVFGVNKHGSVDVTLLKSILTRDDTGHALADSDFEQLMKQCKSFSKGDGKISVMDLCGAWSLAEAQLQMRYRAAVDIRLESLFKGIDASRSGVVSMADLRAKLKLDAELLGLVKKAGGEHKFWILQQLASNKDGNIAFADYDANRAIDKLSELFAAIDTDNSGTISHAELNAKLKVRCRGHIRHDAAITARPTARLTVRPTARAIHAAVRTSRPPHPPSWRPCRLIRSFSASSGLAVARAGLTSSRGLTRMEMESSRSAS